MITQSNIQTITGAKVIINTLKSLGVDTIFGYPGGIVLDFYDELYKQNDIKHILTRHEQAAVHSAEGYARVSGKCGVVVVTSGPGATNTVTGLVNAYLDGYPLVVLTGQVNSNLIGKKAFQEADMPSIAKTCTKAVFQIKNPQDIQTTVMKAFIIAQSGKKGPVLVDIPKDMFSSMSEYEEIQMQENYSQVQGSYSQNDIINLYNKISNSQRPLVVTGGGCHHSKCYGELEEFVSTYNLPVVSTMMGLGALATDSENYFGMIGIFGDKAANELVKNSDLIISLGARWNDRILCMFKDKDISFEFFQIDINPDEISNNVKTSNHITGDIKQILSDINCFKPAGQNDEWLNYAKDLKSSNNKPFEKFSNMLTSSEVIQAVQDFTKDMNITFTSEVGQHQLWAVRNLELSPERKILLSGGAGTMGFGLPSAIGACIAQPSRPVVCFAGDGSIQMSLGELSLLNDYGLNLKIFIMNNGYLGMVRQLQQKNCEGRYSQTKISNPDFVELADSFGIRALRVNSVNEIQEALQQAFSDDNPFIIDFEIEPMEVL
ncbi:MAG: biosynthetic-type acetolactate synthase large subunit [Cyanobacteriota bacterium]|nr:biosynthetic-type acetolactate synthase large subunit [Cyanobacteriota bacterium]